MNDYKTVFFTYRTVQVITVYIGFLALTNLTQFIPSSHILLQPKASRGLFYFSKILIYSSRSFLKHCCCLFVPCDTNDTAMTTRLNRRVKNRVEDKGFTIKNAEFQVLALRMHLSKKIPLCT